MGLDIGPDSIKLFNDALKVCAVGLRMQSSRMCLQQCRSTGWVLKRLLVLCAIHATNQCPPPASSIL